jgi:hypothetical protein
MLPNSPRFPINFPKFPWVDGLGFNSGLPEISFAVNRIMREARTIPSPLLMNIRQIFRKTVPTLVVGLFVGCAGAQDDPLGNAWGKIYNHYDGTQTRSRKDGGQNRIIEETYDTGKILLVKRLFYLDDQGNLRQGVILDGKGNGLGSTLYSYSGKTMVEEQLFDKHGRLIRRLFPPGTLPNVPQNVRNSVAITIDPEKPNVPQKIETTTDRPVTPVNDRMERFTPGIPIGQPLQNQRLQGVPEAQRNATTVPKGRTPMIPQRRN